MAISNGKTHYQILGLEKNASRGEVKDAYKRKALRYHPDKNPGSKTAVATFQEISVAYETLRDEIKRAQYDAGAVFASSSYHPPVYKYPDSFWQGPSNPGQTSPDQKWGNWYEGGEEERQEAEEKRKAARDERRKEKLLAELPKSIAVTIARIAEFDTKIEKLEREKKVAEDLIESSDTSDEDESFWGAMFDRNIKINVLRRQRDSADNEYRRYHRTLRQLDQKKGDAARNDYESRCKGTAEPKEHSSNEPPSFTDPATKCTDEGQHDDKGSWDEVFTPQTQARNEHLGQHKSQVYSKASKIKADGHPTQAQSDENVAFANMKYQGFGTGSLPGESPSASDREFLSHEPGFKPDNLAKDPYSQGYPNTNRAPANSGLETNDVYPEKENETEHNSAEDQWYLSDEDEWPLGDDDWWSPNNEDEISGYQSGSDDGSEEVILIQARLLHEAHPEVQADFWDIAEGTNVCSYCARTGAVLECPLWSDCGLYACEHCKHTH